MIVVIIVIVAAITVEVVIFITLLQHASIILPLPQHSPRAHLALQKPHFVRLIRVSALEHATKHQDSFDCTRRGKAVALRVSGGDACSRRGWENGGGTGHH